MICVVLQWVGLSQTIHKLKNLRNKWETMWIQQDSQLKAYGFMIQQVEKSLVEKSDLDVKI